MKIDKVYTDMDALGEEELLAVVVRGGWDEGVHFHNEPADALQLGTLKLPAGHIVRNHFHPVVTRPARQGSTAKVLTVLRGRVLVDIYDTLGGKPVYLQRVELRGGDTMLCLAGGYGLEVLEETEIVEVKQGPYNPHTDKVRF